MILGRLLKGLCRDICRPCLPDITLSLLTTRASGARRDMQLTMTAQLGRDVRAVSMNWRRDVCVFGILHTWCIITRSKLWWSSTSLIRCLPVPAPAYPAWIELDLPASFEYSSMSSSSANSDLKYKTHSSLGSVIGKRFLIIRSKIQTLYTNRSPEDSSDLGYSASSI